jgi:acyl carrier protein
MNREEKLETIADILEVEVDEIHEGSLLSDFDTWDSIAVLGVISVITDQTGRYPHADEIIKLTTVKDLMDAFEK